MGTELFQSDEVSARNEQMSKGHDKKVPSNKALAEKKNHVNKVLPANSSSSQKAISENNALFIKNRDRKERNHLTSSGSKKTTPLTKTSIVKSGIHKSSSRSPGSGKATSSNARNRYKDCILLLNPKFNKLGVKI